MSVRVPPPPSSPRPFRFWWARVLGMIPLITVAYATGYGVWHLPAATIPALLAAIVGYVRHGSLIDGKIVRDPSESLDRVMVWGLCGGAVGYSVLAVFSVGLPAPEVAFGWRVFGAAVVGAAVGLFAGWGVAMVPLALRVVFWRFSRGV